MPIAEYPRFTPRAPWFGPDLQTMRNLFRGPALPSVTDPGERLTLPLSNGGIDGTGSSDRLSARLLRPADAGDRPLVVLIHGLGGSEESTNIGVTAAALFDAGYPSLLLNLRGAGPSRPLCKQQYHAGKTEDLRDALKALPEAATRNGIVAVGVSLGGNMLLKYCAEFGELRGAVSISAPIDLAAASQRFLDARNTVYHRYLLSGMKREALGEGAEISDEERRILPTIRTILEFDEKIVAPRNGFRDAADYYAHCNARQFLPAIRVPTVVIHALDDPWIPARAYTSFDWSQNPALTPLLAPGGGHVGFHARDARTPWHDRCVLHFLERI